jgi:hypothetical protein
MSDYDKMRIMVGWSTEFGVDIIGLHDGDKLHDVFAVVDKILYDDFSKEPIIEPLRSMAFSFDKTGQRIRHDINKNNLKLLKFLDFYYPTSFEKLDKTYRLFISTNTIEDYKKVFDAIIPEPEKDYEVISS